jgi:AcrR family transcriptional regulator
MTSATMTDQKATPRESTRERLIQAAYQEFVQNGYHGTSMRQIAARAGLAVGGIYNHFDSKDILFAAVLDQYHPYHVLVPALEKAQGESLEAFVRHAARLIEQALVDGGESILPIMFIELLEFQGRHLKDLAERIFPIFASFLQGFAARSHGLRDLPLPTVQRAFISLMMGYFFTGYILRDSPLATADAPDDLQGAVDIFLYGIVN